MTTRPAHGVVGHILNAKNDGTLVFRVYGEADPATGRKPHVDYDLAVDDLKVEIIQGAARLVEGDGGRNYVLDFPSKKGGPPP